MHFYELEASWLERVERNSIVHSNFRNSIVHSNFQNLHSIPYDSMRSLTFKAKTFVERHINFHNYLIIFHLFFKINAYDIIKINWHIFFLKELIRMCLKYIWKCFNFKNKFVPIYGWTFKISNRSLIEL